MRTRAAWVAQRVARNIGTNGTLVTFRWTTRTGGTYHPATGTTIGGTLLNESLEVSALLHWPTYEEIERKGWNEIQVGDLIMDLAPGKMPEGKVDWRVSVMGVDYRQKPVSERMRQSLDAVLRGIPMMKTLVLRRA